MQRKSSLEIMCSPEMQEKLKLEAADAFDMNVMQAFGDDIPDFITKINEYKGRAAEAFKESDPEFAEKLTAYEFKPRDIINLFNDYIKNCFVERKNLAFKNLEVSENIDELSD